MPVLTKTETIVLGVILSLAEAVQVAFIHLPGGVHDAISLGIIVVAGLGITPLAPSAIARLIPVHVATWLTALAGIIEVVQRTELGLGETAHAVIGAAITLLAAVGIAPVTVDHPKQARLEATSPGAATRA